MTKILSVVLMLALAASLFACTETEPECGYAEIRISLPDSFTVYESDGVYDAAYTDGRVIVGILRMSFAACAENGVATTMSPERFSEYYKKQALEGLDVSEVVTDGDTVYYHYEVVSILGECFTYLATFYRTPYAYFVISYIMPSDEFGRFGMDELLGYASTTRVDLSDVG